MTRFSLTREFHIPQGATKVADKLSDAVAYLYTSPKGNAGALMFFGKQAKPVWHHTFRNPANREDYVRKSFEGRRATHARKADAAAERKAWVPDYKVGDILNTCWGYDQTNREFLKSLR
jgi:hypothetical protein